MTKEIVKRQDGADDDEGERQRKVVPGRDPVQRYQHEMAKPGLARVQDHDGLLEMVRLHFKAARALRVNDPLAGLPAAPAAHSPLSPRCAWISSSVSLITFKITFWPTRTLIFSPLGTVLPPAISMLMVSA